MRTVNGKREPFRMGDRVRVQGTAPGSNIHQLEGMEGEIIGILSRTYEPDDCLYEVRLDNGHQFRTDADTILSTP